MISLVGFVKECINFLCLYVLCKCLILFEILKFCFFCVVFIDFFYVLESILLYKFCYVWDFNKWVDILGGWKIFLSFILRLWFYILIDYEYELMILY